MSDDLFVFSDRKEQEDKIQRVITLVCGEFGCSFEEMKVARRYTKVSIAKKCLMYILHENLKLSHSKIRDLLSYKDHTVIIHHIKSFRILLEERHDIRVRYVNITRGITGVYNNHSHRIADNLNIKHQVSVSKQLIGYLNELDAFLKPLGLRLGLQEWHEKERNEK